MLNKIGAALSLVLVMVMVCPPSSIGAGFQFSSVKAGQLSETQSLPPRIIVKMRSAPIDSSAGTGGASLDTLATRFEAESASPLFDVNGGDRVLKQELGLDQVYVLTFSASADLQERLATLAADSTIEYAEPDFVGYGAGAPDDERFGLQWGLHNTGQSGGEPDADVDAPEAWDISTGAAPTVLAIIDTGIDLNHPDLAGKVVTGWDFANDDSNPQDDYGHGTHVAGTAAAATNNGIGVAGVCPGCRVMPLKALNDKNWGYYSWWVSAIEYAVDNGADVINMSMGGTGYSQALGNAVLYAYNTDVPIVAAMMNDGDATSYYPALFAETIAVGSTDRNDDRSSFSNFGDHIDLVAPGSSIWSTMWDDAYASWGGTSMATPHVVGVLGLIHGIRPGYTVEELRAVLRATADDQVGPPNEDKKGWDRYFGWGRLNAAQAVRYVAPPADVTIAGPTTGLILADQTFIAAVSPITAAQPITYEWRIANGELQTITHTGGLSDTVTFTWPVSGTQAITVTAANFGGTVVGTHTITIGAPSPDAILTVCHSGGCDYDNIQDGVDAAIAGNVIKVATGGYAGINTHGELAQVVYVDKSITIRGGYTTAFADPPDPEANPTTVDAQGGGRAFCITGEISPTIEGLRITGGDAAGLGGGQGGADAGGGLYIANASAVISDSLVFGNTAHWGGGLYLWQSDAVLEGNTVASNTVSHDGGGLYLQESDATLGRNTFLSNTASHHGGGLYLQRSDAALVNNVVAGNRADTAGSGLYVWQSSPRLLHTTIARNTGGDGSGIHITGDEGRYSSVTLTNTILVSHTVAITVTAGNTATLNATLWHANTVPWDGNVAHVNDHSGDPAFVDPAAGDYHIQPTSAAADAGVDAGVAVDIDGRPRPQGLGYDIGADEAPPYAALVIAQYAAPNPVQGGAQLTYTIHVTNTGSASITATITDTLPAHVTPGGELVWAAGVIAPGNVWAETFVVTVEAGYAGLLTNSVQATAGEGASGADEGAVVVADQVVTVGPLQGGDIVISTTAGITTTIEIPPGAVTATAQVAYTPIPTITGSPPGFLFAGYAFGLEAYRGGALLPGLIFEHPITVTISYAEANVAGLDEHTLELHYRDGNEWAGDGITVVERDEVNNSLVVRVEHLSEFTLFAKERQPKIYLPLVLCRYSKG
ncbi:MAG: S8 family serine peptidase [Chloroflexota bacterium]|nr:S8 family serine peptidase [Chloroflexota bacterium]